MILVQQLVFLTRSNPCRGNKKAVAEMRDMSTAEGHSVRLLEAQRAGKGADLSACQMPPNKYIVFLLFFFFGYMASITLKDYISAI